MEPRHWLLGIHNAEKSTLSEYDGIYVSLDVPMQSLFIQSGFWQGPSIGRCFSILRTRTQRWPCQSAGLACDLLCRFLMVFER